MLVLLLAFQAVAAPTQRPTGSDTTFPKLVERLSEPGGYFDTDNLISNETSYLHILGRLKRDGVTGGAYIGVGPDQSFSYIAATRPAIAFVIDIRRDNMLIHLLFKSLFGQASNRLEYLCLLFGRPMPADREAWTGKPLEDLLKYVERPAIDSAALLRREDELLARIRSFGVPLSAGDQATIRRLHAEFAGSGLSLRFTTYGRGARPYYPTVRQLFLEKDLSGKHGSFLAREDDFQFVRDLQRRNRVIPVVGDLAGPKALSAIGKYVAELGEHVSLLYTSNVEYYLFQQGSFERFAANVRSLPRGPESVMARSYFGSAMGQPHPQAVAGYMSVQLLQTFTSFLRHAADPAALTYWELVSQDALDLTPAGR
ncbi:MAG: hypothetical protein ABI647_07340 [Gemmatimonadota bacterium]